MTQDYFKFINWKENSCRFDSILALIYFLHQDDPNIFKSQNKDADLNPILKLLNENKYTAAQTKFKKFAKAQKHQENSESFGSAVDLLQKIIQFNYEDFNMIFNEEVSCENGNCKYKKGKASRICSILHEYNLENVADHSYGVIQNFFYRHVINYEFEEDCACNRKNAKKPFKRITSCQLATLPKYLIFCLESFFDQNNELRNHLSHIQIEENIEIEFNNVLNKIELKAILFYEQMNHFTLAFKNVNFCGNIYDGWSYYDDKKGNFVRYSLNLDLGKLFSLSFIPLILCYKISD